MATKRRASEALTMPAPEQADPEPVTQHQKPDSGRFRLQVDRQTKMFFGTFEAAEAAGIGIKKNHPMVQVAVYDGMESVNKIIELP
jgi:hypothetical protein